MNASKDKNGFLELKISDTGCEIPEEYLTKVFDIFSAQNNYCAKDKNLALLYEMIKDNRGDLIVESKKEIGSTYTIYLPIYFG
ncbi:ATP-binding protein [bacterium]